MKVKITYFVHGTTLDNERNLATGWVPGELSALGKKQAEELGKLVGSMQFDAVFCSDLQRAIDSANLAFGSKYAVVSDRRLREIHYGDFTQKPTDMCEKDLVKYLERPFPRGESYRDVERRMSDFLKFLQKSYPGKHIAVMAHRGPQLALDVLLKGKSWKQAMEEDWRHTKSWQAGWEYVLE